MGPESGGRLTGCDVSKGPCRCVLLGLLWCDSEEVEGGGLVAVVTAEGSGDVGLVGAVEQADREVADDGEGVLDRIDVEAGQGPGDRGGVRTSQPARP